MKTSKINPSQIQSFLDGARVMGLAPGIAISLLAASYGVMPSLCFLFCIAAGGLAGIALTPRQVIEPKRKPQDLPQPGNSYRVAQCVFGSRAGVEL